MFAHNVIIWKEQPVAPPPVSLLRVHVEVLEFIAWIFRRLFFLRGRPDGGFLRGRADGYQRWDEGNGGHTADDLGGGGGGRGAMGGDGRGPSPRPSHHPRASAIAQAAADESDSRAASPKGGAAAQVVPISRRVSSNLSSGGAGSSVSSTAFVKVERTASRAYCDDLTKYLDDFLQNQVSAVVYGAQELESPYPIRLHCLLPALPHHPLPLPLSLSSHPPLLLATSPPRLFSSSPL